MSKNSKTKLLLLNKTVFCTKKQNRKTKKVKQPVPRCTTHQWAQNLKTYTIKIQTPANKQWSTTITTITTLMIINKTTKTPMILTIQLIIRVVLTVQAKWMFRKQCAKTNSMLVVTSTRVLNSILVTYRFQIIPIIKRAVIMVAKQVYGLLHSANLFKI